MIRNTMFLMSRTIVNINITRTFFIIVIYQLQLFPTFNFPFILDVKSIVQIEKYLNESLLYL